MSLRQPNQVFSWNANRSTNIPIIFAIIGFICSIFVFKSGCNDIRFHEIYIANKDSLVRNVLKSRINELNSFIDSNKSTTSADLIKKLYQAKSALLNSSIELNNLISQDSSFKYLLRYARVEKAHLKEAINYFDFYEDSLTKTIERFEEIIKSEKQDPQSQELIKYKDSLQESKNKLKNYYEGKFSTTVNIALIDTCSVLYDSVTVIGDQTLILKQTNKPLIDFFDKNSIFGFWLFLSIAQMSFWFLLIPLIIGIVKGTDDILLRYDFKAAIVFSIIPLLFVCVFAYLFYWVLIDGYVIQDAYLMNNYNSMMVFYSIPGYIVAILSFSAYLFLSNNLEALDILASPITNVDDQYKRLTTAFNFTFLCSAIVLSVFVLWVAILFNAINSTEAMKFFKSTTGTSFLNNDFVYLLGLMHTLLLFIFYVPVKLRFNSLRNTQDKKDAREASLSPSKKVITGFMDILSTILVTTSPLIASLISKIMELF
ncbi:MAG TPA: hypothetical protein VFW07_17690 [Parafilimonas sp.]|nr:hypothetical protein [Parafilimonas sp.]